MSNDPINKGPAFAALEELDLNRHRADPREDVERAKIKADWCMENPGLSDSRDRERSATATMVDHFMAFLPDAELGKKAAENLKRGRGKRLGYKSPLHNAVEIVCEEIESKDPTEVLTALDNQGLMSELYQSDPPLIDIRIHEVAGGRVYYIMRDSQERSVSIKTIKNILSTL
jgi:hypothetical protein